MLTAHSTMALSAASSRVRVASSARSVARRPFISRKPMAVEALFGSSTTKTFHDFEVKDIDGKATKLDRFKGQVVLVVNLASACGFTPQYTDLQALYTKYKSRGFSVAGFPCNQFGQQESGSNSEIKRFASTNYGVTFPLFAKIDVNGPGADPVFDFLKSQKGGLLGNDIKWNFSKFLVDKQGNVVGRYPSTTAPSDIAKDIEKYL